MRTSCKLWLGVVATALALNAHAQSDVSLRDRIIANQTHQKVEGNCGVEFVLTANGVTQTHVLFGDSSGATLYAYTPGGGVNRVGSLALGDSIQDASVASGASNDQAFLALSSNNRVYLLQYSATTRALTPYGSFAFPSNNNPGISRVQILRQSSGDYLIAVGTATGRIQVYQWTPGAPSAEPSTPLALGNPVADVALFASSVRALRLWNSGSVTYLAAGGDDGMAYLMRWDGAQLVNIGKGMYHPSAIRELVVNGNRIVTALSNGQVYVWNYTSNSLAHHLTLKEPWAPLSQHSLCALPNDRIAVATAFVRVYSLANGQQVGDYGGNFAALALRQHPAEFFTNFITSYIWQPYLVHASPVRVLPYISNPNNYFVVTSPQNLAQALTWRTAFLQLPSGLSYQVTSSSQPVYSLTSLPNGLVSGRVNGSVVAPWGTRNLGQPVFALERFTIGSTHWVIGSYGAGSVFAWSSANTIVSNVLPADAGIRVLYAVRVVGLSGNQLTFATVSGDGKVELWQWTVGASTPATLLSSRSLGIPLHELTVNANQTELAVASYLPRNPSAWRIPLANNQLDNPQVVNSPVSGFYPWSVSYHPTNPDLLACGSIRTIWVYNRAANANTIVHVIYPLAYHVVSPYPVSDVFMVRWISNAELAAAYTYNGYVGVFRTDIDSVTNSRATDGQTVNWIRGGIDRAPQQVYEPHRDRIYALLPLGNALATASADGTIARWSLAGEPVATTNFSSTLSSVDFSPINGAQVLASRVLLSDSQHALLWMNYYHASNPIVLSPRVPNPPQGLQARGLGYMTNEVFPNDVTCRYFSGNPLPDAGISNFRLEVSEDGEYALFDRFNHDISTNPPVQRARFAIIPEARFYNLVTSGDIRTVDFPTNGAYNGNHALSPTAARVAISALNQPIRIYDRSGNTWNFSTPSSTVDFNTPRYSFIKFLADDVLAVAYTTNPQQSPLQINIYQLVSGSWQLRQSVDTGLLRSWPDMRLRYFIDAVPVTSGVRVAVACDTGLVLYSLTRSNGVATLTEVGRSTWAANGFIDVARHHWVRFSRHNPNILGVANGNQVVVYDLTNLFNW